MTIPHSARSPVRVRRGRISIFTWVGIRIRTRFNRWRARWAAEREMRGAETRQWAQYDFTHDDIAAVAAVLETKWDHTGFRLLGLPRRDFVMYASALVTDIKCGASDTRLAARLADFEEELGLRDSPAEHRAAIAAQLRMAARHRSR